MFQVFRACAEISKYYDASELVDELKNVDWRGGTGRIVVDVAKDGKGDDYRMNDFVRKWCRVSELLSGGGVPAIANNSNKYARGGGGAKGMSDYVEEKADDAVLPLGKLQEQGEKFVDLIQGEEVVHEPGSTQ